MTLLFRMRKQGFIVMRQTRGWSNENNLAEREVITMRNASLLVQLFLILGYVTVSHGQRPDDAVGGFCHSGQADYMISRYVFGSGGLTGAAASDYVHRATAGETFVGGMQGDNIFLGSGFWHSGESKTGVNQDESVSLPTVFELCQNYPNPFNPQTTIQYNLPKTCTVTVEIFNIVGQRVRLLLGSQSRGAGTEQVVWDGRDDMGKLTGSGIYMYRLIASAGNAGGDRAEIGFQQTKKMLLVK